MTSKETHFRPAERVATQLEDVWSLINNSISDSAIQPVANLGQGFFDNNPPAFAIKAAKEALDEVNCNQYSPTRGRPRLRKAIAQDYSPFFGRKLNPDTEVAITSGANEGILCVFMGFISPGDEIILFEPFFDQYISNIEMAGGIIRYVTLRPPPPGDIKSSSSKWSFDEQQLQNAFNDRTKMIVLNSPHNPTGKVFSRDELQFIAALCVQHNVIILSDEVYDRLSYVPFVRIAGLSEEIFSRTITVGSAGKAFRATGWRIGYLIGPEHLIKYAAVAHTRICYSSVSPLQEAVAVAFEKANQVNFWDHNLADMRGKLSMFTEVFDELQIPYFYPDGGYLFLADLRSIELPEDFQFPSNIVGRPHDFKLAYFLIRELGVATIPSSEFYTAKPAGTEVNPSTYLRFAVCKQDGVLEDAKNRLRQIKKYLKQAD